RDFHVTGVQTCALPISSWGKSPAATRRISASRSSASPGTCRSATACGRGSVRSGSLARQAWILARNDLRQESRDLELVLTAGFRSEARRVGKGWSEGV